MYARREIRNPKRARRGATDQLRSSGIVDALRTIWDYFHGAVTSSPDATLFEGSKESMTYAEAAVQVSDALDVIANLELNAGDRVVCYTEQTVPLALFMITCAASGIVPVPISPVFSLNYVRTLVRQCGARAIYTTADLKSSVDELGFPILVFAGPRDGGGIFGPHVGGTLDDAMTTFADISPPSLADAFLIQATSGSTGTPKLVLRNHAAFSRYAHFVGDEIAKAWSFDRPPRIVAANALTHAFAGHMLTMALRFGAAVVVPDALDINIDLQQLRALDPDILPMTPRVLKSMMLQHARQGPVGNARFYGPSARLHVNAGGMGDVDTFRMLRSQGVEVLEFYGSSEASVIAVTPLGQWRERAAGRVVADADVKLAPGGEILVKSPGVMLQYYGDRDLTELVFDEEEFYRTGDIGTVDDEGYLRILGRKRDLFNTVEGTNIYPERIEIMLESLDFVEQVYLVGDGLPYLSAHIMLRHPRDRTAPDTIMAMLDGMEGDRYDRQGFLRAEEHFRLYERAGKELERLNERLELLEQIVAFALYVTPFPPDVYKMLRSGKQSRNRVVFLERFAPTVELLYSRALDKTSPYLVPPRERRFRPRVAQMTRRLSSARGPT